MIEAVENATGVRPLETYLGDINLFAVFDNEDTVSNMTPNFDAVSKLDGQGLIISSPRINMILFLVTFVKIWY